MTVNDYNQAVDLYADGLYRFVVKSIKNQHTAEDIVQDSYEKLRSRTASRYHRVLISEYIGYPGSNLG
jgi:DNA-directed RNA polymerase specialized sigma24 family protein